MCETVAEFAGASMVVLTTSFIRTLAAYNPDCVIPESVITFLPIDRLYKVGIEIDILIT
jgi:hypothetical protein